MRDLTAQLNAKLAEIEIEAEKKRSAARLHFSILEALPGSDAYAPPSVHIQNLWTAEALVCYRIQRYASIAEGKSPDADLLAQLLEAMPPVPKVLVADGCKSFRPVGAWTGETTPVHPYTLVVDMDTNPAITVEWATQLPNGTLTRIQVEMPLHGCSLGTPDFVRGNGLQGREGPVVRCDFRLATQTPGCPSPKKIRWSNGGNKYTANNFTLYWPEGDGPVDLPGLWRR